MHGFTRKSIINQPDFSGDGILYEHDKTGCRVYHLHNEDKDNLFCFGFATPVFDNTGVTHILEHSVLCGSREFPLKDPFKVLLQGSIHSFLNAITFPDRTLYPAGSMVETDYFNLMRVYGDSVFFPELKPEVFYQEGVHFINKNEDQPSVNGIVFNEMMGSYSDHDAIVEDASLRNLFDTTMYRFDSGGNPEEIPSLTFKELVEYHKTWYHPSNCRIYLYGSIDTDKQLRFLDTHFLSNFEKKTINYPKDLEVRWDSPREFRETWPASDGDNTLGTSITVNWLLDEGDSHVMMLAYAVMSEILLGNPGSPLYKALIDSGLGNDLSTVCGLENEIREPVFSAGLRGAAATDARQIEKLVLDTLQSLVDKKLNNDLVEGALRSFEFNIREVNSKNGVRTMRRLYRGWMYDCEPHGQLGLSDTLAAVKQKRVSNPFFFEDLIKKKLIDNPHRSLVTVEPDKTHFDRMQQSIQGLIHKILDGSSAGQLSEMENAADKLKTFQETPDEPEYIARIPTVKKADLPGEVELIRQEVVTTDGRSIYLHDIFTNSIVYCTVCLPLDNLNTQETLLLPLLLRCMTHCGTYDLSYEELEARKGLLLGGLRVGCDASRVLGDAKVFNGVFIHFKSLESLFSRANGLVFDILRGLDLGDGQRIEELLYEHVNDMASSLVSEGHSYAALHMGAGHSSSLRKEEQWSGISQYLFAKDLLDRLKKEKNGFVDELINVLSNLYAKILGTGDAVLEITASNPGRDDFCKPLVEGLGSLRDARTCNGNTFLANNLTELGPGGGRGFIIPSSVGYSAAGFPCAGYDTIEQVSQVVLSHILKTGHLWEEIRMKNGAYGAFSYVDPLEALLVFLSYRDPDPQASLSVFRESLGLFNKNSLTSSMADRGVIGVAGKELRILAPYTKGIIGLKRSLYGITHEMRQRRWEALKEVTANSIKNAAEQIDSSLASYVCVLSREKDILALREKKLIDSTVQLQQ